MKYQFEIGEKVVSRAGGGAVAVITYRYRAGGGIPTYVVRWENDPFEIADQSEDMFMSLAQAAKGREHE